MNKYKKILYVKVKEFIYNNGKLFPGRRLFTLDGNYVGCFEFFKDDLIAVSKERLIDTITIYADLDEYCVEVVAQVLCE